MKYFFDSLKLGHEHGDVISLVIQDCCIVVVIILYIYTRTCTNPYIIIFNLYVFFGSDLNKTYLNYIIFL